MQPEKLEVRKIRKEEISLIRDFAPVDWKVNLEEIYLQHYGQDYFYPIVVTLDHEIIGTGTAVVNDNATWVGMIIVSDKHRNKGIGKFITDHLIDYSKSRGNDTVLLSATELGLSVYKKIGFVHDLDYLFFKTDDPVKIDEVSDKISEISEEDYSRIFEIDSAISGEERKILLRDTLKTGFKYKDNIIEGFYLPDFGKGLILAESEIAGLELLKFRFSRDTSSICVPETNKTAIDFFISLGFNQYLKAPRMFLNKNVNWISKNVYSRGCGYLG